ncbi:MAG: restriction endonuclease subunit S [Candidatus Anammoxibacter sp.]
MNNWRAVNEFVVYSTKGITPKYVVNSSIMVLNQRCVRDNNIDFSLAQYTDDSRPISNTKILKIGDILFNSTGQGTSGRCAFVSKLPKNVKVITDSHMLLLRCKNYYEAKCLGYILYSFEKKIQAFMDGSTGQGELDKVRLFNIQVDLTKELPVQQKIAAVLSVLDAKIELNNRLNAELEASWRRWQRHCMITGLCSLISPSQKGRQKP